MQDDIDVMGLNNDKAIFAECKFTNKKLDMASLNKFIETCSIFDEVKEKYYYLFSKSGFTNDVREYAKKNKVVLVDIDRLINE